MSLFGWFLMAAEHWQMQWDWMGLAGTRRCREKKNRGQIVTISPEWDAFFNNDPKEIPLKRPGPPDTPPRPLKRLRAFADKNITTPASAEAPPADPGSPTIDPEEEAICNSQEATIPLDALEAYAPTPPKDTSTCPSVCTGRAQFLFYPEGLHSSFTPHDSQDPSCPYCTLEDLFKT